jgi:hypothetical protein
MNKLSGNVFALIDKDETCIGLLAEDIEKRMREYKNDT